ncbi:hypothetical protein DFH07DRAFT_973777 [Mycena maculata]|uniref:Uncharacterized protein n=1 Tax=Mycena maculata TaxID=230809 RepID=A0AAD7HC52_9AGAR|nr:hypothetical protein DFH07DRAFT_973777 [Mycena maculata]
MEAANVAVITGDIERTFNSSKSLLLSTVSPIDANVNLFNEDTNSRYIWASINPESSKESDAAFNLTASAQTQHMDLDVLSAPLNSNISRDATTFVKLPITYEGSSDGSTVLSSLAVAYDEAEDPTGEGRTRSVEYD